MVSPDNTWQYRQGTIDAGCGWFRYHLYEAVFDPHGSSEVRAQSPLSSKTLT